MPILAAKASSALRRYGAVLCLSVISVLIMSLAECSSPAELPFRELTLVPNHTELRLGDTVIFQMMADSAARDIPVTGVWTVSDPEVLALQAPNKAIAVGVGTVAVTLRLGNKVATASVVAHPATLIGTGDIARCPTEHGAEKTAEIIDTIPGVVFTAGDNVYESGTVDELARCYEPTWGRFKSRTRPAFGNHDSYSASGAAYYDYWGDRAGPRGLGYYSYDIGPWHVVVINVMIDHGAGSQQERWLRTDLALHQSPCTIAYWHFPRFSSAQEQHSDPGMQAIWDALYDYNAEIVISGHSHTYERFALQTPTGQLDSVRGIKEFVVGTGGASLLPFDSTEKNSELRNNSTFGVLRLELSRRSYTWEFIPADTGTFRDHGMGVCH